jgi:mannose-6-phosphate isomerase-like protein (cupin superfamily)
MTEAPIGRTNWPRPASPYEQYTIDEGVPIYRGMIGVEDVRQLELGPWDRTGGRGAFVELSGAAGLVGIYLLEVPAAGSTAPEHHLFEEVFTVLEGRGSTEVWPVGQPDRVRSFEWQKGSVFSVPLNTWHRFVNASRGPVLLLAMTNQPVVMEIFHSRDFVFSCPFDFIDRYPPDHDAYFAFPDAPEVDPNDGRYLFLCPVIPNAVGSELPLDGQRGAGHRRWGLALASNAVRGFIAEYPAGRYSKTHAHQSGPVLVCLSGTGYTLTWHRSLGPTPWRDGKGHLVKRQDYRPGGLVSAAPGGDDWFHGHFGSSKDPLRVMAYLGGFDGYPMRTEGAPGDVFIHVNQDINEGGKTIQYRDEDPEIRRMFEQALRQNGATSHMPEDVYR